MGASLAVVVVRESCLGVGRRGAARLNPAAVAPTYEFSPIKLEHQRPEKSFLDKISNRYLDGYPALGVFRDDSQSQYKSKNSISRMPRAKSKKEEPQEASEDDMVMQDPPTSHQPSMEDTNDDASMAKPEFEDDVVEEEEEIQRIRTVS